MSSVSRSGKLPPSRIVLPPSRIKLDAAIPLPHQISGSEFGMSQRGKSVAAQRCAALLPRETAETYSPRVVGWGGDVPGKKSRGVLPWCLSRAIRACTFATLDSNRMIPGLEVAGKARSRTGGVPCPFFHPPQAACLIENNCTLVNAPHQVDHG